MTVNAIYLCCMRGATKMIMDSMKANKMFALPFAEIGGGGGGKRDRDQHANGLIGNYF